MSARQATARAVADKYGVPRVFERWEDMLAEAMPEIVVIASPPHLHHAIALAAFAGGAHVLCEKPLAMTAPRGANGGGGRACRANRHDGLQLALPRRDAAVPRHGRGGPLGRPFHIGVRWLGGRWAEESGARDLAHGPRPGGPWRDGRHGRARHRSPALELRRDRPGDGRRRASPIRRARRPESTARRMPRTSARCWRSSPRARRVTFTVSRVARGANEQTVECYGSQGGLSYKLDRVGPRWYRGQLQATEGSAALAPARSPRACRSRREMAISSR